MLKVDGRDGREWSAKDSANARFAREVLRSAARPERIAEVIADIVGDRIEVGPVQAGPGGLASVTATGWPGKVRAAACDGEEWDVALELPIRLRLRVDIAGVVGRFVATGRVRLRVGLVLEDPCGVFVRTEEVRQEHVDIKVRPVDRPARLLDRLADVRSMVVDHVVAYVGELLSSREISQMRRIDIAQVIDRAWEAGLILDPAARTLPRSA
ncbi:hypothetical protein U3653_31270 [Nocardia sp. CDC186]|uniref:Uncharacterized protein n=1 Tax=Nocardia implantans TaxID=3108168 RepID=A0ABU6B4B1_9NOCA|nr:MULTISPECIES: hypothetical protein [unclassified Nocardia]MBF6196267.1 hypothetical protein [Nocardia beijingensis]MEA3527769.1 hypothetical protein [Nocardia sp. CDC192]MEB3514525.1 hypothetical protein [Nocardia sp. CDC186]